MTLGGIQSYTNLKEFQKLVHCGFLLCDCGFQAATTTDNRTTIEFASQEQGDEGRGSTVHPL